MQTLSIQRAPASKILPPIRSLRQSILRLRSDVGSACTSNLYLLQYLSQSGLSKEGKLPGIAAGLPDDLANEVDAQKVEPPASEEGMSHAEPMERSSLQRKRVGDASDDIANGTEMSKREPIRIKLRKTG